MHKLFVHICIGLLLLPTCGLALAQGDSITAKGDPPDHPPIVLLDGGFYWPALGSNFEYQPYSPAWSFTGGSGVQGNGSLFGAPAAPEGTQTAFLQAQAMISGEIGVEVAGDFTIKFSAATRASDLEPRNQQIAVSIDGTQIGVASVSNTLSFENYSFPFTIAQSGTHTISFSSLIVNGDHTAFLDAVSITRVVATSGPIVPNGSFETPPAGSTFLTTPAGAGWIFVGTSGIQGNGSALSAASAPDGIQTAFLQATFDDPNNNSATMSTTVNLPRSGSHTISFQAAQRANSSQKLRVSVDGNQIGLAAPTSTSFTPFTYTFTAQSGVHTLSINTVLGVGQNTTFVDAVDIDYSSNVARVGARWSAFLSALDQNLSSTAVQYFVPEARGPYQQAFLDLGSEVQNISSKLSALQFIQAGPDYVRAAIPQSVNGQTLMRFLTFVYRDDWYLLDM